MAPRHLAVMEKLMVELGRQTDRHSVTCSVCWKQGVNWGRRPAGKTPGRRTWCLVLEGKHSLLARERRVRKEGIV